MTPLISAHELPVFLFPVVLTKHQLGGNKAKFQRIIVVEVGAFAARFSSLKAVRDARSLSDQIKAGLFGPSGSDNRQNAIGSLLKVWQDSFEDRALLVRKTIEADVIKLPWEKFDSVILQALWPKLPSTIKPTKASAT